jgi:hypothetical protein
MIESNQKKLVTYLAVNLRLIGVLTSLSMWVFISFFHCVSLIACLI